MRVHVTISDGRTGRDPSKVQGNQGETLATYDAQSSPNIGDRLSLPSGDVVEIIGINEDVSAQGYFVVAHVGNIPD